jgi:hypothetical protein
VAPQADQKEPSAKAIAPKLSIPSLNTGTTAVGAVSQEQNLQQVLQALSNSSQLNLQQLLLAVSNQAQPLYMLAEQVRPWRPRSKHALSLFAACSALLALLAAV